MAVTAADPYKSRCKCFVNRRSHWHMNMRLKLQLSNLLCRCDRLGISLNTMQNKIKIMNDFDKSTKVRHGHWHASIWNKVMLKWYDRSK